MIALIAAGCGAQQNGAHELANVQSSNEVSFSEHNDTSPPLFLIPAAERGSRLEEHEVKMVPRPRPSSRVAPSPESVVQAAPAAPQFLAPIAGVNFDGVGQGFGSYTVCCAPPDTNGDIGPNHYVETVNLDYAIFNKAGAKLFGPVPINTLWAGFGGLCQTDNDGDPIVLYDPISDRWVVSQFAVTGAPANGPYYECVAVSTTGDPTGSYYRYSFSYADFPDYPKMGVWPDAYYITYNLFKGGSTFNGGSVCALDRSKMLTGAAATQKCFNVGTLYGGILPTDLDGATLPPAGAPNYIVGIDTTTTLVYWKFHADFVTPANATLTGPISLPVATYASSCAALPRGDCIPQGGGGTNLESLSDRAMYRLAYRNFTDHQALVVNHTIEVGSGSTLHSGVRWYELRPDASNNLSVYQQSTYAPDANWRWMGSAAMDKSGNMAMGYSVSSSTIFPQIHYTGRLATDPLNTMTQGESVVINGTGAQNGSLARWGDYSMLGVDPVDDCTFWYTNEYIKATGSFNWSTRIASFKLPGCGVAVTPDFGIGVSPASATVTAGSAASYTVTVTPSGGFTGTVTFSASGLPAGAAASFNPTSVPGSGTSALTVSTSTTTPAGSYPLTITGTSGALVHSATATLVVSAPPVPDYSLSATPASSTVVQGSGTSYAVTITRTNGFAGAVSFTVSGLPAGAAGSFSPNPSSTTSSTLSVTTATTTPTGSYPLTITGTSGSLTHSTGVTLVVNAPADYALSASPASSSVSAGAGTSYAVTITRSGGFAGAVTFSVAGLPAGAAGTFSPNPSSTTSSTLSVTTATTTPVGSYALTITGASGALTHTASVTLVVTAAAAGNFSLAVTPASVTAKAGTAAAYTVNITRTGGFTGGVTFSLSGAPAGSTITFNPNPSSGASSALTVTTPASTLAGSYPLTITGVSGALSHTATATLVETAGCVGGNGDC